MNLFRNMLAASALMLICISASAQQNADSDVPANSQYILTPQAPEQPRINGAKIYGARPGAEIIYRIPASGIRPMNFSAEGLPRGLKLDSSTGIIRGKVKKAGTYDITFKAENAKGSCTRPFRLVIGDKIALTPPMGWNSWNCWGNSVSQEKVMSSAQAMIDNGLVDYGWAYINIDDGWQGLRTGKNKELQPNSKFPDMKALGDFLHENGLKFGIYSGPWVATYAGHIGEGCENEDGTYWWIEKGMVDSLWKLDRSKLKRDSLWYHAKHSFAEVDAKQWAEWGVDYLKYDWQPNDLWHIRDMAEAIDKSGRDIVYSLSNSSKLGIGPVLMEYCQCWRTTGDIRDNWKNFSEIGFGGQDKWAPYKRPGNWPDADMLVVGKVGWGPKTHWCKLTADEQYTHITLWSMLASPLLIGCDLADIDDFTLSLLCNSEVIDVNQDMLGLQASRAAEKDGCVTYVKPLDDGSLAVAIFNLTDAPASSGFSPKDFGILGKQTVRDLWRQQDIASVSYAERWESVIAPHGCVLVKLYPGTTDARPMGFNR